MSGDFVQKVHPISGKVHFQDFESDSPLLLRAGSILPVVPNHNLPTVINTATVRKVPIELWVLPTSNGSAHGDLFYDDGESIDTVENGHYNYYEFKLDACHLTINVPHSGYQAPVNSNDILKVTSINVPLSSTKAINNESVHVTLNDNVVLKTNIQHDTLKINTTEHLDLLKTKGKVSIVFKNKHTNECFTH